MKNSTGINGIQLIFKSNLTDVKRSVSSGTKTEGLNKILPDMNLFSYIDFISVLSWSRYYFRYTALFRARLLKVKTKS